VSSDELKSTVKREVSAILDGNFSMDVVNSERFPDSDDGAVTYANFVSKTQTTKLIDAAVLCVDVRLSAKLSLANKPETAAKLYSGVTRSMTHVARHHRGHVAAVMGDHITVLFDGAKAVVNAVECAFSMNSVGRYLIANHFKPNEVTFGIGIDRGKMLATRIGVRNRGAGHSNYQDLVWMGRVAAPNLADVANRPAKHVLTEAVDVAYEEGAPAKESEFVAEPSLNLLAPSSHELSTALAQKPSPPWRWQTASMEEFISGLKMHYLPAPVIAHASPRFACFSQTAQVVETQPATPPILMTDAAWNAYRAAEPDSVVATEGLIKQINVTIEGYSGFLFGGDVIYPSLKD
jgi:class 3 adenylate cyclase